MPPPVSGARKSKKDKPDWYCKVCEMPDSNKPYRNFGFRTSCNICACDKGICILHKAPDGGQRTRPATAAGAGDKASLAQRQVADAKAQELADAKNAKLQKQLDAEREQLKKVRAQLKEKTEAAPGAGATASGADAAKSEPSGVATLATLKAMRDSLRKDGVQDTDDTLAPLLARVEALEAQERAAKPAGQRLSAAQIRLAQAQKKARLQVEAIREAERKRAELEAQLLELQESARKADEAVVVAQREVHAVMDECRGSPAGKDDEDDVPRLPPDMLAFTEQIPESFWECTGGRKGFFNCFELLCSQLAEHRRSTRQALAVAAGKDEDDPELLLATPGGAEAATTTAVAAVDVQPSGPPGGATATAGATDAAKDMQRQLDQLSAERDQARRDAEQAREQTKQLQGEAAGKVEAVRTECSEWAQEQLRKLGIDQALRDKFVQNLVDSNTEREQDRDKRRKLPTA